MPESLLHDTRDKVIALSERFNHLEEMVAKNSGILKELHESSLKAQGGWIAGKFALGAAKMLGSGGAGAAILAAVQSWSGLKP
jgi:hypothetical protein